MTAAAVQVSDPVPQASKGRVLLVEDQPALRRAYARVLERAGYSVMEAADGRHATDALALESFEVILTDLSMPGMTGSELLAAIRELALDVPVLLMTGNPTVASAIAAIEHGAVRYLIKPVEPRDLLEAVDRAATLRRIARVEREAVAYLVSSKQVAGDRATQEAKLQAALATLWMAYQPIVDCGLGRAAAYEALVRTNEPTVPHPGALFTLAEELGQVHQVGRAIRASVARTLADSPPSIEIFVNLHPSDFLDDELYSQDAPLAAFASRVVLEVTERAALDETAGIAARAARLRQLGYRIAIDDLGAGYAGLNYLVQLTPEVVKIDMSLVRNIHQEPIKQKLFGSLVTLCRDLGMLVVAEGVETDDERRAVIALGCDQLQGYLFARPGKPFPEIRWPEVHR